MKIIRKEIVLVSAILLALVGFSSIGFAYGPSVEPAAFTTNYTVLGTFGGNYTRSGSTIRINVTVGNRTTVDTNVSAWIYNSTKLLTIVHLLNESTANNTRWTGTWTVSSGSSLEVKGNGNITIYANETETDGVGGTNASTVNALMKFGIDSANPVFVVGNSTSSNIVGGTGVITLCGNFTDTIGLKRFTAIWYPVSVPQFSAITNTSATILTGSNETQDGLCYVLTPDKFGDYQWKFVTGDNTTHYTEGTTYTYTWTSGGAASGGGAPPVSVPTEPTSSLCCWNLAGQCKATSTTSCEEGFYLAACNSIPECSAVGSGVIPEMPSALPTSQPFVLPDFKSFIDNLIQGIMNFFSNLFGRLGR